MVRSHSVHDFVTEFMGVFSRVQDSHAASIGASLSWMNVSLLGEDTAVRVTRCKPHLAVGAVMSIITVLAPTTALAASPGERTTPDAGPQPAVQSTGSRAADDYYRDAMGKTGPELKGALTGIIGNNTTTLNYDQVWDALKVTDADPNNPANVVLLYSGRSQGKDTNGGDADNWNREHVWAKSHGGFGTSPGPGTDVHHLRSTDVSVNSERGSKDFDLGGSEVDEAPGNFTDDDSYEPRAEVKGDVARMIFYMAVRYDGSGGFPDLELNDDVNNGEKPLMGRMSVLREWHAQDPPDAFEQQRNQVIYDQVQRNRNPFIDHPEWVNEIWG